MGQTSSLHKAREVPGNGHLIAIKSQIAKNDGTVEQLLRSLGKNRFPLKELQIWLKSTVQKDWYTEAVSQNTITVTECFN